MEKFILELIRENNRVIIPNFGAFIISKENGVSILFNNFLSFNDGLLVNYVAEKKGVDTVAATDQVFSFVDGLKKVLEEKGEYLIKSLGIFKKDDNGVLRFKQGEEFDSGLIAESQQDENSVIAKADDKAQSFLLDIDNNSKIDEVPEEEKIEVTTDASFSAESSDQEGLLLDVDNEDEELDVNSNSAPQDASTQSSELTDDAEKEPEVNEYIEKDKRERKRKNRIVFILLGAIIIIGLLIYFLFVNKSTTVDALKVQTKVESKVLTKPLVKDSLVIVKDSLAEKSELEALRKVEEKAVLPGKKGFYIIVGGFKTESNAINMVAKLKGSGFNNAQIITKGSMFLVSADSNVSYRKVEERQQEILANNKMGSWLYTIK